MSYVTNEHSRDVRSGDADVRPRLPAGVYFLDNQLHVHDVGGDPPLQSTLQLKYWTAAPTPQLGTRQDVCARARDATHYIERCYDTAMLRSRALPKLSQRVAKLSRTARPLTVAAGRPAQLVRNFSVCRCVTSLHRSLAREGI